MSQIARVAISSEFLGAFAAIPQTAQGKVSKFLTNFQRNPMAPGINYEKIHAARDPNMRSVRIDEAWRGIVLKPEKGNIFLLLWVDRHDDAYAWASRHRCAVNEATGAIQVFEAVPATEEVLVAPPPLGAASQAALFAEVSDKDLVLLGVPGEMIARVRAVVSEDDLDAIQKALPSEAYEALFLLAAGDSVNRILQERETRFDLKVDTQDFETALQCAESLSRFVVVDNESELAAVLNASLTQWRIFLHPSQQRMVHGDRSGPVRILGGAGTGKTVVAMHRTKVLAEMAEKSSGKILFTTFTRNLATDIQANLKELCSPNVMAKIEVANLDAWVQRFLNLRKYEYSIAYESDKEREHIWDLSMTLKPSDVNVPDTFYREEWARVIQPQGIETIDDYKKASRVGRGTTLSRSDRTKVWPVFEEYRSRLLGRKMKEVEDAYRDAANLIAVDRSGLAYSTVIVDEAQDMGAQAFRLIRALVEPGRNDLFIVGDGHQRIYGRNKVVLSKCGIDIRGRSRKLRVNYRTTEEIRKAAVAILEGCDIDDLDGGQDNQKGYKSLTHGESPRVFKFNSAEDQAKAIAALISERVAGGLRASSICVVARTNNEVDDIGHRLGRAGVKIRKIRVDESDGSDADAVRIATMHRVKGLEFDLVVVASVNDGLVPLGGFRETEDPVERQTTEVEERALLYVALTRARKEAAIFSYGATSMFLSKCIGSP